LAKSNRYQFQWWALSLIDARPYGDKKKGADTGIDGYLYFFEDMQRKKIITKRAIVQVKSGKVSVKDIRDLGHVVAREGSEIGILVTLEEPTAPMKKEAIAIGLYHSKSLGYKYRKMQILTIEELLAGKKPSVPIAIPYHKDAERVLIDEQYGFEYDDDNGE